MRDARPPTIDPGGAAQFGAARVLVRLAQRWGGSAVRKNERNDPTCETAMRNSNPHLAQYPIRGLRNSFLHD